MRGQSSLVLSPVKVLYIKALRSSYQASLLFLPLLISHTVLPSPCSAVDVSWRADHWLLTNTVSSGLSPSWYSGNVEGDQAALIHGQIRPGAQKERGEKGCPQVCVSSSPNQPTSMLPPSYLASLIFMFRRIKIPQHHCVEPFLRMRECKETF